MNILHKILLTSFISTSLMLTACSDKKSADQVQKAEETKSAIASGNWQTKASELSSANATDIKSDLAQLNQITNRANTQTVQLRNEAQASATDPEKLKAIFKKSNDIQKNLQQEFMALNLKSSEVQNIRTQMMDSILSSQKLYELSTASDFNMAAPSEEFKQLGKRSVAIQQKVGAELDALNQQYP